MYRTILIISMLCYILIGNSVIDTRIVSSSHQSPSILKHFEAELDTRIGYWSPSTSSIDWCERNYMITPYIAEFWNCMSSFSMCILGVLLFLRGLFYKIEARFLWSSMGLCFVGLGSAYFHGTLTHIGQMADELPMVYSMIIWWFILLRMDEITTKHSKICGLDKYILFGVFYACLWTFIHSLQAFVIIFQVHMSLMVVGGMIKLIRLYHKEHYHARGLKNILIVYVSLVVLAFICWTIDQQLCERLNALSSFNPQLHAWWHIIGAVHCHLGIVCGEAMRQLSIKYYQERQKMKDNHIIQFKPDNHLSIHFYFGLPYVDHSIVYITDSQKIK